MMKRSLAAFSVIFAALMLFGCGKKEEPKVEPPPAPLPVAKPAGPSDQDISDAYLYLLGRMLIVRQEIHDFRDEGFKWNEIVHRKPGAVIWGNPNLDVATSEAWIALDEKTPVILDVPEIKGRYYTVQMLNGWGETVLNINERTFKDHPSGKFALVLKGASPELPADAVKVELPGKKNRLLVRVELGAKPKDAERLQQQFKLTAPETVEIAAPVDIKPFANDALPGAEVFDKAEELLASEPDTNPGMEEIQKKVAAVAALSKSDEEGRVQVDKVVKEQAHPRFMESLQKAGKSENGWARPAMVGNYGEDYVARTLAAFAGIWANSKDEAVYFTTHTDATGAPLDGGKTYRIDFPKDALPADKVDYFWSITAVDTAKLQVIPNKLNRFLLNKESKPKPNKDGSLTLWFSPDKPKGSSPTNWLPTHKEESYQLTFRFYGPKGDILEGSYFPPGLVVVE